MPWFKLCRVSRRKPLLYSAGLCACACAPAKCESTLYTTLTVVRPPAVGLVVKRNDYPRSVLHLRQGACSGSVLSLPYPPLYLLVTSADIYPHGRRSAQVIGNKWDTYLDLLQAEYSEG